MTDPEFFAAFERPLRPVPERAEDVTPAEVERRPAADDAEKWADENGWCPCPPPYADCTHAPRGPVADDTCPLAGKPHTLAECVYGDCDGVADDTVRLTERERDALWETIATVRDAAPRTVDDADTDDIIDAILDSGWVYRLLTARLSAVEAERDRLRETVARVEALADCERAHGNEGNLARVYGHPGSRRTCIRLHNSDTWIYDPRWESQ